MRKHQLPLYIYAFMHLIFIMPSKNASNFIEFEESVNFVILIAMFSLNNDWLFAWQIIVIVYWLYCHLSTQKVISSSLCRTLSVAFGLIICFTSFINQNHWLKSISIRIYHIYLRWHKDWEFNIRIILGGCLSFLSNIGIRYCLLLLIFFLTRSSY